MKFIHISDLHIGKRVNEFSMLEDQKYILKQIVSMVEEEQPDGVLIAGDVYDKPVPPAEAVQAADHFLTDLADMGTTVFVISGNHDSPERLAFGGRLMSSRRVYMSPVYSGHVEPVEMKDEYGSVYIYMLPFVKPATVRRWFPGEEIESFDDAVKCAVEHITHGKEGQSEFQAHARNLLMAHQFVMGASCCESEERSIGGLDQVSASIFQDFDYVALGHIHGPQKIGRETMRYSGTPLKYSFSETGHKKSAVIVEMRDKGDIRVGTRLLKPLHDMREIRGTYEQITSRGFYQGTAVDDYLHITLTDEEDILDAIGKLRSIYANVMKLDYDNQRTRNGQVIDGGNQDPKSQMELFEELYQLQNNQPMSQRQEAFTREMMEQIWEDMR